MIRTCLWAIVILNAKPIRNKESKYYIPQALYNKTLYPSICRWRGFSDGRGAWRGGFTRSRKPWSCTPSTMSFWACVCEVLRVTPIKHSAFKTFGLVRNKSSKMNREPCFFKSMIVVHKLLSIRPHAHVEPGETGTWSAQRRWRSYSGTRTPGKDGTGNAELHLGGNQREVRVECWR